jgi:predicted amidophosphoribosyltransferase
MEDAFGVEPWLGEMLIDCAAKWITCDDWDMIIPVPLHPSKKKKRGFNQAERLGRYYPNIPELP